MTFNWEAMKTCPVCKNKRVARCKCNLSDSFCENKHHWFMCPEHGCIVVGQSDHSKASNVCQCKRGD